MAVETERDGATWYECEECGLLLETYDEAEQCEERCDAEEPSYMQ